MLQTPRVMQVVLSLDPGGSERMVIEICRHVRSEVELSVCCLDEPGEWARELVELGIQVTPLSRKPGFRPFLALQVARLARRHRAQVLHCHHYTPFVYGALASRLGRGTRLVYTEHGRRTDEGPSAKRRWANLLLARLSGQFVAVSDDLRRYMLAEGFSARRLTVVHNGIDPLTAPGPGERQQARRALGLPGDVLVIGTVARLDPVKDLGTLIQAFGLLLQWDAGANLILIGAGPEREGLLQMADELGVRARVRFVGHRDDARSLLPAFDVYANTSLTEGVSVTILEAMAASLPVVASRVGGTSEIVVDGETGFLVPSRSPSELSRALQRLAASPQTRARLAANGRRRCVETFGINTMAANYVDRYRELSA